MLLDILREGSFALSLSPGFFQFYALAGFVHALDDFGCLKVSHASGASAGALVAGFLAAGMPPSSMIEHVLAIKREDIWDMGGFGGLLKGQLVQKKLEEFLPVQRIEECKIPLGVTAWELFGFKTKLIQSGNLATAIRASCTFPLLFQPVDVDGTICIDGGVWDTHGIMALPDIPDSKLIVNVVFGLWKPTNRVLPKQYQDARLLTIVLKGLPSVSPFTMESKGPLAFKVARAATCRALLRSHIQQLDQNHWCCYIDCSSVDPDRPLGLTSSVSEEQFSAEGESLPRRQSFPFLDIATNSNTDVSVNVAEVVQPTDEPTDSSSLTLNHTDLDILQALCELESSIPEIASATATSVSSAPFRVPSSSAVDNSSSRSRGRKRRLSMLAEESAKSIASATHSTSSLADTCKVYGMRPVPMSDEYFDDINEISREESLEITEEIVASLKTIALLKDVAAGSTPAESAILSPSKSRRKSTSSYAKTIQSQSRWVVAIIARPATAKERKLDFTHAVQPINVKGEGVGEEVLVALTAFGYLDLSSLSPLKSNKLAMPQDTWIALDIDEGRF